VSFLLLLPPPPLDAYLEQLVLKEASLRFSAEKVEPLLTRT